MSPEANKQTATTIKDSSAGFSDIKNTEEQEKQQKRSETKINSPKGITNSAVNNAVYGKPKDQWGNAAEDQSFTPIKALNTFLFDWKIKARVTKKHAKKVWKNSRSEGTLLNVELIDNQGS